MAIRPINICVNNAPADYYAQCYDKAAFSWGIDSDGEAQQSFRIQLYADSFSWDSGEIQSSDTTYVLPVALQCGFYDFTITINGNSEQQGYFKFASQTDLEGAKWITQKDNQDSTPICFAKQFDCKKEVARATLFVSGIGCYKVYVNDFALEDGCLQPVVSNFKRNPYCTMEDISDMLLDEKCTLLVEVGDGWRRNHGEYYKIMQHEAEFFGTPQLYLKLIIDYVDGTQDIICSDESFKAFNGGTVYSNLFNGETYDASKVPEGIYTADFDISGFENAVLGEELPIPQPQCIEAIIEHREIEPVAINYMGDDTYILDFGENVAGYAELQIPYGLEKGHKITLRYSEELDLDGNLCMDTMRDAASCDTYIAGEQNDIFWTPKFVYHGFRYIEVRGLNGYAEIENIKAIVIYTDMDNRSFFNCGSGLVNQIQNNILRTERSNLHGIATDCPQRDERMGWLNDATVRFDEMTYNFNAARMLPKIIQDIAVEQDEKGAIPCTVPFLFGLCPTDPVCSSYISAGWLCYLHYGNTDVLAKHYNGFKAWNECLKNLSKDGIVEYSLYGDWAGPQDTCFAQEDPHSKITPDALMSTGYHYYNYKLLAKIAAVLGNAQESAEMEKQAEFVQKAYLDKWYNPETGVVATGSQGCQAFSLWLGILPQDSRQKAADRLYDAVVKADFHIAAGNLTTRYLFEMLSECGYTDAAWKIILQEDYPSYGHMIQHGATTIWERFEQKENNSMNSHNHPMYGAVGSWFYSHIAGIRPTDTGWTKFKVEPHIPTDLNFAHAEVDTVLGMAGVKWFKRYGKLNVHIKVPYGAECTYILNGKTEVLTHGFYTYHYELEE